MCIAYYNVIHCVGVSRYS